MDWADTQAAHADRAVCRNDFGPDEEVEPLRRHVMEPELVGARDPGGLRSGSRSREAASGFYLSGHLSTSSADEVRMFAAPAAIARLLIATGSLQLLAGSVSDLRVVNGARAGFAISSSSRTERGRSRPSQRGAARREPASLA